MNNDWLKQTNELINDWQDEYNALHNKYNQIAEELMELKHRISVGHEMISAYMEKHGGESTNDNLIITNLANKSYPTILIEAAKQNNGIVVVSELTDILVKADMGTPEIVRHNIGNALWRSKDHFTKLGRGRYRFTNNILSEMNHQKDGRPSGLRDLVGEIKAKNPQWSKKQVINYLKEINFDFKGKRPENAVNIVWVWWGFHKENKQQSLLK